MSSFPRPKFVQANGIPIAVYEAGAGPAVILLHGFPELAYSWRHQIAALAASGWRAIALDLRGYGRTGPHGDVAAYSMKNLSADVIGILDALEIERAVVIGHDFGGVLAWVLARDHSKRVAGIISLNSPYTRRADQDLVETMRLRRGPTSYMVMFQEPGVGEALLERDVTATFQGLMRRPAMTLEQFQLAEPRLRALPVSLFLGESAMMGEPIMSDAELHVYIDAFRRTGFTAPLNWYRNLHRNWLDAAQVEDRVHIPALMVSASDDIFLPPQTTRGMERHVPDLERALIEHCGHWTQHEQPERTNAIIIEWLERRMRPRLQMASVGPS
jgi:soluble epoxide hydrolase / lipid-phosphate phosphatase